MKSRGWDVGKFGIGQAVRWEEDPRLLRGKGNYVNDINLADQTHAVLLRSPHANAKILSLEISAASHAPGVVAVLTGADLAADSGDRSHPPVGGLNTR